MYKYRGKKMELYVVVVDAASTLPPYLLTLGVSWGRTFVAYTVCAKEKTISIEKCTFFFTNFTLTSKSLDSKEFPPHYHFEKINLKF